MRRKDREIKSLDDIFSIVKKCNVVHVGMVDDGKPYVVALNFGFDRQGDNLILYMHSAQEGRKIDVLRKNPDVYFQMNCSHEFIRAMPDNPCDYGWKYGSVMGSGKVEFITDDAEKTHALNRIIQHLDKTDKEFDFPSQKLSRTCVYRIMVDDFSCKRHA